MATIGLKIPVKTEVTHHLAMASLRFNEGHCLLLATIAVALHKMTVKIRLKVCMALAVLVSGNVSAVSSRNILTSADGHADPSSGISSFSTY